MKKEYYERRRETSWRWEIEWHGGGATPAVGNEWSTMRGRSVAGAVALIKKGKHVALALQNKKGRHVALA